jgi:hypothetical protein
MTPITQWAGRICMVAATLIVSSELLRLIIGLVLGPDSATTLWHTLTYGLALGSMYTLLLAVTALYAAHQQALGVLGLVGYLTASIGTVLVADHWHAGARDPDPPAGWIGLRRRDDHRESLRHGVDHVRSGHVPQRSLHPDGCGPRRHRWRVQRARPLHAVPDPPGRRHRLGRLHPHARPTTSTARNRDRATGVHRYGTAASSAPTMTPT